MVENVSDRIGVLNKNFNVRPYPFGYARFVPFPRPTGAGMTCVDLAAAATLKVPIVGQVNVSSATHVATPQPLYPIQLQVAVN